jgi:aspartate aminotransferase
MEKKSVRISSRMRAVSESATLKVNALTLKLKTEGLDVINLAVGEPDFNVPAPVKEAVIRAVRGNRSKYTDVAGIRELRQAIADRTNREQKIPPGKNTWKPENVIVSNGGKQALFNAFLSLLDPGDAALIPSPHWVSYPEMARICGASPVIIKTLHKEGFKLTPGLLKKALKKNPKAKILVLNSPSNPAGIVYSAEEFKLLGEVISGEAPGLWVISDEIYGRIVFDGLRAAPFLEAAPELRDRCVTVNSLSKSAAMTGWRAGWSVAPEDATAAMITLQGQSTSNINSLAQYGALEALKMDESTGRMRAENFQKRRDVCIEVLSGAGKLEFIKPKGAFYLYVDFNGYFRPGETSDLFAERLLREALVSTVPGRAFGNEGYLRLSFAANEKILREGCLRILKYLGKREGP